MACCRHEGAWLNRPRNKYKASKRKNSLVKNSSNVENGMRIS